MLRNRKAAASRPMYKYLSIYSYNMNYYCLLSEEVLSVSVQSLRNAEVKQKHIKYYGGGGNTCVELLSTMFP